MRVLLALALAAGLAGCAAAPPPDTSYADVARIALADIDRKPNRAILIAGPAIAAEAKAALAALGYRLIAPEDAPDQAFYSLPPGHRDLRVFSVKADTANVAITRGPIYKSSRRACGETHLLELARSDGVWKIVKRSSIVC